MKATKKAKRNLIIIFSACILIALIMICIIIWQTVEVGKLNTEINRIGAENSKQESLIEEQGKQIEYYESEKFKEDYSKFELGYTDGDGTIYN